jgi:toxin ParE1/3/4
VKPAEFHPQAEAEFAEEVEFYFQRAPGLAVEFAAAVEATVTFIRTHSEAGAPVRGALRRWRVRSFPYSIIYREEPERIYVLALSHHRRRPGLLAQAPVASPPS